MISPQAANASFSASSYLDAQSRTMSMDAAHQAYATETTASQGILPPLRAHRAPTQATSHNTAPTPPPAQAPAPRPASAEEASPEAPASAANPPPNPAEPNPEPPSIPAPTETETDTPKPQAETAPTTQQQQPEPEPEPTADAATTTTTETASDPSLQPPDSPALLPTVVTQDEDEDDGLNLLGSLERELDRQEGVSSASAGNGNGGGGSEEEGKEIPKVEAVEGTAAVGGTAEAVPEAPATMAEGAEGVAMTTGSGEEASSSADAEAVVKEEEAEEEGPAAAAAPGGDSSS
jgi:hypothetical protein